jgi:PAS domain S-box
MTSMNLHSLSNDLYTVFLKDDSEQSNTEGINVISNFFSAPYGILFYKNARGMYKFCINKSGYPISLSPEKWMSYIPRAVQNNKAYAITHWIPPVIDTVDCSWVCFKLLTDESSPFYVFLGYPDNSQNGFTANDYTEIIKNISNIIAIKNEREKDIKRRQDTEDQFKLIQTRMTAFFETSRDTIYAITPDERIISINEAGLHLFGVKKQDELVGKRFTDFTTNPESHDFFRKQINEKGYIDDHEIVIRRQDGQNVYCLESAHAIKSSNGSTIEIQGILKDISERIKNERELWLMNIELTKINEELKNAHEKMVQQEKMASIGQLAAGVAHEINNPLGFLNSNLMMIEKYFNDIKDIIVSLKDSDQRLNDAYIQGDIDYKCDEANSIFQESEEGFTRIKAIVSNLPSFSRAGASNAFTLIDINKNIESTLTIAYNEIKYSVEVTTKLGEIPKITANKGEINQVLLNLIVNASQVIAGQHRPEKGHITIETSVLSNNVLIQVIDDGPGITKEIQSKIFDPFFTTKEPGKGTGPGLSISYDIIVSKHHGTLPVESEPGRGTKFSILLPTDQNRNINTVG